MHLKATPLRGFLRGALAPIICVVVFFPVAHAQSFSVLHSFTNAGGGAYPSGSLILDSSGNLYGTAADGGNAGCNNPPAPEWGPLSKCTSKARVGAWEFWAPSLQPARKILQGDCCETPH
jgi:hypothetical protein